jgi:hypothetical protein
MINPIKGLKATWKWLTTRDATYWTAVAAVAALIGVAVSTWTLKSTVASSSEEDQRARYETISAKEIDLDSTFIQHPEQLPYFWSNQPICGIDPNTHRIAEAIAVQRADNDAFTYSELIYIGNAPEDKAFKKFDDKNHEGMSDDNWDAWTSWSQTIVNHFLASPVTCDAVRAAADSYPQLFTNALKKAGACDTSAQPTSCWTPNG